MIEFLAVGMGGFLGAASRYLLVTLFNRIWNHDFPLGTFAVNSIGSFLLGLLIAHPYFATSLWNGSIRLALGTGFLGSFTTFSTLMYESFMLAKNGKAGLGLFNTLFGISAGLFLSWTAIYVL